MQSPPKVLIVGSGPAGLILALSLLKNGIPVRIIEKDAKHHNGERGPGVMPRTLEIEHFLGAENDVRKTGARPATIHFFDSEDPHRIKKSSSLIQNVEPTPAFPITRPVVLGQWRHQAILRKHIEALGGVIELGSAFIGCTQDGNGVTAVIKKTTDGVEHTENARFEYLVGADGGRSTVRKAMGVDFHGETREEGRLHLVDTRIEGLGVNTDICMWGSHKTAMVVVRQTVEPGLFQVIFSGPEVNFDYLREHDDPQTIQNELHRIMNRTDIRVTGITWHGEWRPNIRMVDHFQVGRLFIIGDAAHTHSPTGGQGLNSSVQDAFNLGWKLALSIKGNASPHLLESFQSERLPVIAEMLQLTTKLLDRYITTGSTITQTTVQGATEKQSQKSTRDEDVWFRDRRLLQLDLHYRWSPVVVDERFAPPSPGSMDAYGVVAKERRAGDRAPDAPSLVGPNAPDRLFDIFHPAKHTVLLFVADQSQVEQARAIISPFSSIDTGLIQGILVFPADTDASNISGSDMEFVVVDSEGHAFTNYGINTEGLPTVVVVRPDAIIGAFLKAEAGTRKYLSAVFQTIQ